MTNPPRPPRRSYVCGNPSCQYWGKLRAVTMQHVGSGLYLAAPNLICECGVLVRETFSPNT